MSRQLELDIDLQDIDKVITLFENKKMYRWYNSEIITAAREVTDNPYLLDFIRKSNMFYRDEIIEEFKKLKASHG